MKLSRYIFLSLLMIAVSGLGWQIYVRLASSQENHQRDSESTRPIPVVTAPIEQAPIALERAFSGTLEAHAEFVAAPQIGGIIEHLSVNLGDRVARGQVVATLDNAEYLQSVAQAEAELEVARANLGEAGSLLRIAERELQRVDKLSGSGVSSASQRDTAKAEQLIKKAHLRVTMAQVTRAEAQLETARIRLGYTQVMADWDGDDAHRMVAERYVDAGENVSANTPLLKIIKLNPITAVIFVTERDYADLKIGQPISLVTDAYADRVFSGVIQRIAPIFREATRQARIEIEVDNPEQLLKPGMFVRARVTLERVGETTVIPIQALTRRDGQDGVFVLSEDGKGVTWHTVTPGIRQDERLQVTGDGLHGQVVVLGQQMLKDGSSVLLTEQKATP